MTNSIREWKKTGTWDSSITSYKKNTFQIYVMTLNSYPTVSTEKNHFLPWRKQLMFHIWLAIFRQFHRSLVKLWCKYHPLCDMSFCYHKSSASEKIHLLQIHIKILVDFSWKSEENVIVQPKIWRIRTDTISLLLTILTRTGYSFKDTWVPRWESFGRKMTISVYIWCTSWIVPS